MFSKPATHQTTSNSKYLYLAAGAVAALLGGSALLSQADTQVSTQEEYFLNEMDVNANVLDGELQLDQNDEAEVLEMAGSDLDIRSHVKTLINGAESLGNNVRIAD